MKSCDITHTGSNKAAIIQAFGGKPARTVQDLLLPLPAILSELH